MRSGDCSHSARLRFHDSATSAAKRGPRPWLLLQDAADESRPTRFRPADASDAAVSLRDPSPRTRQLEADDVRNATANRRRWRRRRRWWWRRRRWRRRRWRWRWRRRRFWLWLWLRRRWWWRWRRWRCWLWLRLFGQEVRQPAAKQCTGNRADSGADRFVPVFAVDSLVRDKSSARSTHRAARRSTDESGLVFCHSRTSRQENP